MMRTFPLFRAIGLTVFLVSAGTGHAQAQAQIYVLESSAPAIKVGSAYALTDSISIPEGGSIRAVMPSGKTQTIKGPYSGPIGDLAKGEKPNEGVLAWIKNLVQTGGANERTPGATRSMRAPEPRAGFSWTDVPVTANSTFCVQKGAQLQLLRAPSQRVERITVVDQASSGRADVEWAAGSETVAWPQSITLRADATYVLLAPDNRPAREVKVRVLDRLPGDDDVLAELAARDCKLQFDAWVKQKTAEGRRRAS
jgi:hypothetical protein